jgi:hypothetical protein
MKPEGNQNSTASESPADESFYYIVPEFVADGLPKKWPLVKSSELSSEKRWILTRSAMPDVMLYLDELPSDFVF